MWCYACRDRPAQRLHGRRRDFLQTRRPVRRKRSLSQLSFGNGVRKQRVHRFARDGSILQWRRGMCQRADWSRVRRVRLRKRRVQLGLHKQWPMRKAASLRRWCVRGRPRRGVRWRPHRHLTNRRLARLRAVSLRGCVVQIELRASSLDSKSRPAPKNTGIRTSSNAHRRHDAPREPRCAPARGVRKRCSSGRTSRP